MNEQFRHTFIWNNPPKRYILHLELSKSSIYQYIVVLRTEAQSKHNQKNRSKSPVGVVCFLNKHTHTHTHTYTHTHTHIHTHSHIPSCEYDKLL